MAKSVLYVKNASSISGSFHCLCFAEFVAVRNVQFLHMYADSLETLFLAILIRVNCTRRTRFVDFFSGIGTVP